MAHATQSPDAYDALLDHYETITGLGGAAGILSWDQEVMMPEGGTPARSTQKSAVSTVRHDLLTDQQVADWLDDLADADLTDEQAAVVREIRREHERAARVPSDLIADLSEKTSEAHPKWKQAREEDDFSIFAPVLEDLIDLKREYATHIDPDADAYEVLFADYEPYLDLDTAERVLERLRDELVPLIADIRDSDVTLADPFAGSQFDVDTQEDLARDVLDTLGYDWEHGRIDTAPHPFSSGTPFDARVTTRFDPEKPVDALLSTIHEFGHARYTLGLPRAEYGTPLGESRDLTVHESQSRLWENHIGRSPAFWEAFLPEMKTQFPQVEDATPRAAFEAANEIFEDNLIRVEADELTYHMHIVVRFEIERELIEGDLDVADVPEAWNDKYEEYLGVRPETDAEGCLQDIHWSQGSIGYFPTYSLGSVLAAQIFAALEADIGPVDERVREGDFDVVGDWLESNVHQHGARYTTPDLVREATGEAFTADYFLDHVHEKYGELYDL
ncbi:MULTISPECIES: carboxypeptidase M32 [Halobacterium]|uniref:carboxypeptidase M32 n=1 Tax=Halobacterium TaxID=2239 RepID=UPI00196564C7|nr:MULTISPECIES: carboxypeptidase M32 [Halobacterium]MDL0119265.1 carboxypeptidase M32 [Halobacterium salinarum]MDL0122874.1 carboxypeptidase M32 [Halobacterium salinarum]MDL0124813.1 carboxypeptidase M32 [Halobacterium salinarum]MDL0131833.1 carboxypeptidase M32 [Halobacterium salinarum]MDL0136875.1 carboxypeptidase M32 [Halobacterium salinarum]